MIGQKLRNRYQITTHLGDGSTATVYQATDTRLGRQVALKILLPHVRSSTRSRFFQEARSAAQLNHPNIMAIYDMVEDDEQPFLVVEYVEGASLSSYIPSSADVTVDLGYQIATALAYAHEHDIIHRDIKPANIQVTPSMQVKLMDLGLALPREATRVTADGMIIGTPAYLSPEQAQGHDLDHRTDIYSLGIVLYELVTGQLPFDADEIAALLLQQVRQPAPPPRLLVPDLPASLEQVILKTLEKRPARRFQSCRILAEALQDSLHAPTAPDSPTLHKRPEGLRSIDVTQEAPAHVLRLILADDHRVLRKALVAALETRPDFVVIAEVGDGDSALRQTLALQPDVLVLDLNMPGRGGLDVLPEIRAQAPDVKVLVLTGREESGYIVRALRAGANGYILKSSDEDELIDAILRVNAGHLVLGQGVTEKAVTGLLDEDDPPGKELTKIEHRILLHVARGDDNSAIAQQLRLAMPLVIETIAGIMDKLGAGDRNEAALVALRDGHILLDELQAI